MGYLLNKQLPKARGKHRRLLPSVVYRNERFD